MLDFSQQMLPEIPEGLFPIINFTNCTNGSPCPPLLFSGAKEENLGRVPYLVQSIHFLSANPCVPGTVLGSETRSN